MDTANARQLAHVRAQLFIFLVVSAFTGKVEVVVGEEGRKHIWVEGFNHCATGEMDPQLVRRGGHGVPFARVCAVGWKDCFEQSSGLNLLRRVLFSGFGPDDGGLYRTRAKYSDE